MIVIGYILILVGIAGVIEAFHHNTLWSSLLSFFSSNKTPSNTKGTQ